MVQIKRSILSTSSNILFRNTYNLRWIISESDYFSSSFLTNMDFSQHSRGSLGCCWKITSPIRFYRFLLWWSALMPNYLTHSFNWRLPLTRPSRLSLRLKEYLPILIDRKHTRHVFDPETRYVSGPTSQIWYVSKISVSFLWECK